MPHYLIALLTAAVFISNAEGGPGPKDPVPGPLYLPTEVGDRLVYEEVILGKYRVASHQEEVTGVQKKSGVILVTTRVTAAGQEGHGTFTYRVSGAGVDLVAGADGLHDPPYRLLRLPATKGEWWENKGPASDSNAGKFTAAGEEEVEVPAGKFKTVRVEWASELMGQPVRATRWLAPGRGPVKERYRIGTDETLRELKSFTRVKE